MHQEKMIEKSLRRWRRIALPCSKKIIPLLRGITSKHDSDFYCLSCLCSFRTKNQLELHKKLCENKNFCGVVMPSEDTKILEFKQYQKSDKTLAFIYVDLQSLI